MSPTPCSLRIFADPESVAAAAAEEFFARSQRTLAQGRAFTCALSGGTTPRLLFAHLADRNRMSGLRADFWDSVHFFWGDERVVPPDHPDSNYRLAHEELIGRIHIPARNVHRIRAEFGAAAAAAEYERELRAFFDAADARIPRFDLMYLGMGGDGHTASLFPHSEALREDTLLVAAPWVEKLDAFRITLTLPVFRHASCVAFMTCGQSKAEMLRRVLCSEPASDPLPAQLVRPHPGELLWLVDRAAASLISRTDFEKPV